VAQIVVTIDVVSDVICPWCFLGKRRLDKALAQLPEIEIEVVYRPFFLDPTIPKHGIDRHKYMADKFGEERLKTIHDPLIALGKEDGVPYHFDKITRTPNTLDAHRLIRWALPASKQAEMKDALLVAYWRDGMDIGDHAVLADIATTQGFDKADILRDLASDKDSAAVLAETQQAQAMGITGVPTFIINHKYGISGAQSVEVLVDAIKKVVAI
jgi:predicted DsbA family dithiol-disulfide isomerase